MRFSLAIAFAAAGLAAAQTTTAAGSSSSASACGAQYILDACLQIEQPKVLACQPNDWSCMCTAQNNVLVCYNNCPDSSDRPPAQNQQIAWCNAAGQLSTTAATVVASKTTSNTSPSSSSTSSSAQSQASKGAANMLSSGNGLLAVAVGVAGLL